MKLNSTIFPLLVLLLLTVTLLNSACVSKKKFQSEIANRDSLSHFLNVHNQALSREVGHLKLDLALKTGEGNALREVYDKQIFEIKKLEKEIERLNRHSSSTTQSLNEELRQRDALIAEKDRLVSQFGTALKNHHDANELVLSEFQALLVDYPKSDFAFEQKEYRGQLVVSEKQLFKPGTDQFAKSATMVLDKIAKVLNNHPELQIQVVGHADSQSAAKGFKNRLDFSTRRAVEVAQALTRDFYVNGSQVTAAGRADFEPRTSNETEDGRSQNRRIEILFQPRVDELRKMAGEVLEK